MSDGRLSRAQIVGIQVSKYSYKELKQMTVVNVTRNDMNQHQAKKGDSLLAQFMNEGGYLFDPKMGATDKQECKTCNQDINGCLGHFGRITFPKLYPFISSIDSDIKLLNMILNSFCYMCRICNTCTTQTKDIQGKLITKPYEYTQDGKTNVCPKCKKEGRPKLIYNKMILNSVKNLEYYSKLTTLYNMNLACPVHNTNMFELKDENYASYYTNKGNELVRNFSARELQLYLEKIASEDLEKIGVFSRPENMIIRIIPVLPNFLRLPYQPDDGVPVEQGTNSPYKKLIANRNELFVTIQKKGEATKESVIAALDEKIDDILKTTRKNYEELIFSSDTKNNTKSIKRTIDKKEGLMRKSIRGKRGNYCARSVVVPDETLNIYECGLPAKIAKKLTTEEVVNDYNIDELKKLMLEGEVKAIKRKYKMEFTKNIPDTVLPFDRVFIKRTVTEDLVDKIKKMASYIRELYRGDKPIGIHEGIQVGDVVVYAEQLKKVTDEEKDYIEGYEISGGKKLIDIMVAKKIQLKIGDVIYRYLRNGDVVIVNRNPTLHKNSMLALLIEIRDGYTIRMPIQLCQGYGMDLNVRVQQ